MRIIAQLFTRDTGEQGKNEYLVCGLIKTDVPLKTESVNVIDCNFATNLSSRDIHELSEGNCLDSIVKEPIWRRFK